MKCSEFVIRGNRNNENTRVSPWFSQRCEEAKAKCTRVRRKYRRQEINLLSLTSSFYICLQEHL